MLHGDIKVNDHIIATWKAVRVKGDMTANSVGFYDCTVSYTNLLGEFDMARYQVKHVYGEGAIELVAKIMIMAPWSAT